MAEVTGESPDEERFEQPIDADFSAYEAEREHSRKRTLSEFLDNKMKAKGVTKR